MLYLNWIQLPQFINYSDLVSVNRQKSYCTFSHGIPFFHLPSVSFHQHSNFHRCSLYPTHIHLLLCFFLCIFSCFPPCFFPVIDFLLPFPSLPYLPSPTERGVGHILRRLRGRVSFSSLSNSDLSSRSQSGEHSLRVRRQLRALRLRFLHRASIGTLRRGQGHR